MVDTKVMDEWGDEEWLGFNSRRQHYKESYEFFALNNLKIVDRDNPSGAKVIPFKFNEAQRHLDYTISRIEEFNLKLSTMQNAT